MPLLTTINPWTEAKVYLWKINESFTELRQMIALTDKAEERLASMKSSLHQKGFLSVRALLNQAGLDDRDLFYNDFGKPFLRNGQYVSITHSHERSAIIIAPYPVGIDLELMRPKILRIAHKFSNEPSEDLKNLITDQVTQYTYVWTAKESVYKMISAPGLSFRNDISFAEWRSIRSPSPISGQALDLEAKGSVLKNVINTGNNRLLFHFKGLVQGEYVCGMTREL